MDNLLRLARSHEALLSDPEFEAQCDEFNEIVTSALTDLTEVRELQRALFNFRNAAAALKIQCSKISQRRAGNVAFSRDADSLEAGGDRESVDTGTISDPQSLLYYRTEHKCHHDQLALALLKFKLAAQHLEDEWQKTDGTHAIDSTGTYPFHESFDELLSKISVWTEATFRRADGYCASCCIPDHLQCSLTSGCPCCDMR
jgi:hypothetical protein